MSRKPVEGLGVGSEIRDVEGVPQYRISNGMETA